MHTLYVVLRHNNPEPSQRRQAEFTHSGKAPTRASKADVRYSSIEYKS